MVKAIRSKKDYRSALGRIYDLMQKDLKKNSDEYFELKALSILTENYEEENFPIDLPDPIEAIKFRMEQMGMIPSDLISIIGSKSRVSEIMNKRRPLSISMIRAIHDKLKIPADILIKEYM